MKAFFLTGSAALLLACGVTVFPANGHATGRAAKSSI